MWECSSHILLKCATSKNTSSGSLSYQKTIVPDLRPACYEKPWHALRLSDTMLLPVDVFRLTPNIDFQTDNRTSLLESNLCLSRDKLSLWTWAGHGCVQLRGWAGPVVIAVELVFREVGAPVSGMREGHRGNQEYANDRNHWNPTTTFRSRPRDHGNRARRARTKGHRSSALCRNNTRCERKDAVVFVCMSINHCFKMPGCMMRRVKISATEKFP